MGSKVSDVLVVGAGPAGASAALFLARAGLAVVVVDAGGSPLGRVARVANFPGCLGEPSGSDLLGAIRRQAEARGARFVPAYAEDVEDRGGVFWVFLSGGGVEKAERLLLATGGDLRLVGVLGLEREGTFVATDRRGRTSYPRVYAAGAVRGMVPEHAAVSSGDGAFVAVNLVSDLRGEPYRDHGG